jgi:uncharacterized protein (TIGR03067 family)
MLPALGLAACLVLAETDPLAGTWNIVAVAVDGKDMVKAGDESARQMVKGGSYTFRDDKLVVKNGPAQSVMSYKADASAEPATIDLFTSDGKKSFGKGIYRVLGDELQLYIVLIADQKRPKSFDPTDKSGALQLTLKRQPARR